MDVIPVGSYLCSAEILDKSGNIVSKPSGTVSFKNNGTWDDLESLMLELSKLPKGDFGAYITLFVPLNNSN